MSTPHIPQELLPGQLPTDNHAASMVLRTSLHQMETSALGSLDPDIQEEFNRRQLQDDIVGVTAPYNSVFSDQLPYASTNRRNWRGKLTETERTADWDFTEDKDGTSLQYHFDLTSRAGNDENIISSVSMSVGGENQRPAFNVKYGYDQRGDLSEIRASILNPADTTAILVPQKPKTIQQKVIAQILRSSGKPNPTENSFEHFLTTCNRSRFDISLAPGIESIAVYDSREVDRGRAYYETMGVRWETQIGNILSWTYQPDRDSFVSDQPLAKSPALGHSEFLALVRGALELIPADPRL